MQQASWHAFCIPFAIHNGYKWLEITNIKCICIHNGSSCIDCAVLFQMVAGRRETYGLFHIEIFFFEGLKIMRATLCFDAIKSLDDRLRLMGLDKWSYYLSRSLFSLFSVLLLWNTLLLSIMQMTLSQHNLHLIVDGRFCFICFLLVLAMNKATFASLSLLSVCVAQSTQHHPSNANELPLPRTSRTWESSAIVVVVDMHHHYNQCYHFSFGACGRE